MITNGPESRKLSFPKALPVLLFVAQDTFDHDDNWLKWHDLQAVSVTKGEVIKLPGSHYLQHTQSKTIAEDMNKFLNKN